MKKKPRQSSPVKKVLGGIWWGLVMAVAVLAGVVGKMATRSSLVAQAISNPLALLNSNPREVFGGDGLTLLILGTDEIRTVTGWAREKDGTEHAISKVTKEGARADMILVARLDFATNRITGLSVPRDTAFRLPRFDGKTHKINAYYNLAPKGESKETMVRAIEYILPGVKIDRTIAINYDAFQELVNTVGGVPVVVPKGKDGKGLYYNDWSGNLHIDLKPGPQTLSGSDAMGYVRFRHDSESDYGRQERQKEFIASFKNVVLHHLMQLPEVAEQSKAVLDNALNDKEIIGLVAFSRKVPQGNIKLGMLPTYPKGNALRIVESKRDEALREYGLVPVDTRTAAVER